MKDIFLLEKRLKKDGYTLCWGKFEYWNNVPYVINKDERETWLVWNIYCSDNSQTIIKATENNDTYKYILKAIKYCSYNLGKFKYYNKKTFGAKIKYNYYELDEI